MYYFYFQTVNVLSRLTLTITMNKDEPWTLEPWHVRASFRKSGFHLAEDAIKIPSKTISGPDMNLEDKEFYVTVTVRYKMKIIRWLIIKHTLNFTGKSNRDRECKMSNPPLEYTNNRKISVCTRTLENT